ncbi:hypothetical protein ACJX0J_017728, partial [Zea mays]
TGEWSGAYSQSKIVFNKDKSMLLRFCLFYIFLYCPFIWFLESTNGQGGTMRMSNLLKIIVYIIV